MIRTQAPPPRPDRLFSSIPFLEAGSSIAEPYLRDASNFAGHAEKIVLPRTEEEVIQVLVEASWSRTPVTIAGGGTGLVGGRVPQGGIVMSMEKMNKVRHIEWHEGNQQGYAVLEPGVMLKDFEELLEARGLFYPPDPTGKYAFMGGTVATNASGARSFKYGPTRAYVRRLRVVLAEGDLLELVRGENRLEKGKFEISLHGERIVFVNVPTYVCPTVKNVAGYYVSPDMDLIDLFIGSEGTLGVLTEIELKIGKPSEGLLGGVLFFASETDCYSFMEEARRQARPARSGGGISPRVLEFFDRESLRLLRTRYPKVPGGAGAALFVEEECAARNLSPLKQEWVRCMSQNGAWVEDSWLSGESQDHRFFRQFRQDLPFIVKEEVRKTGFQKVGTDMSVPDRAGREMLEFYLEELKRSGIQYLIFGHLGDNHLHANLLPKSRGEFDLARGIYEVLVRKALDLGGTVSAEHGVGKLKLRYLEWMYGREGLKQMARVKRVLDPRGILSPGNVIPPEIWQEVLQEGDLD